MKYIECPICGEKYKSLITHLFYKHNITTEEFKIKYPDHPLQISNKSNKKHICPICDKEFKNAGGLGTHMTYIHNNKVRGTGSKLRDEPKEGFRCKICKRLCVNLSQHIEIGHKINWDDYCNEYDWDKSKQKYVSNEARKTLSKNKKAFYDSERGAKLKKQQSKLMSGSFNPATRKEVREKISKSKIKTGIHESLLGYGIFIKLKDGRIFRSFNEFMTLYELTVYNIQFEYEKNRIVYWYNNKLKTYISDITIGDCVYELKDYSAIKIKEKNYDNVKKYESIKETYRLGGLKFEVVNRQMLHKKLGLEIKNKDYYINLLYDLLLSDTVDKILIRKRSGKLKTFIEKDKKFNRFDNVIDIRIKEN